MREEHSGTMQKPGAAAVLKRPFEPFFTKQAGRGTSLGLSQIYRFIKAIERAHQDIQRAGRGHYGEALFAALRG
jgi:hypothetical protein